VHYTDDNILELIDQACNIVNKDGSYDGANELKLNLIKKLLLKALDDPKYNDIRNGVSECLLFTIIHKAIIAVKNSSEPRKRRVYNQAVRKEFGNLKKKGFRFLFLVNIELPRSSPVMHFNIGGDMVDWISYPNFKKSNLYFSEFDKYTDEAFDQIYNKKHEFISKYSLVSIYIYDYDPQYCINKATEIYQKFLGLLNLALHFSTNSFRMGLYQKCSYSNLTGMNIIFILYKNKFVSRRTIIQYSNADGVSFNQRSFSRLDYLYKKIRSLDKRYDLFPEIQKFLLLYQGAMKSPEIDVQFLSFWEIIELFLKRNINDNNDQIINRAKWIFNNDWVIRENIELIREKRNDLVHGGTTSFGIEDIHHIQYIAESIFQFYITTKRRYKVKPYIFEYFDLKNVDGESFKLKREVMNYIVREHP
jgi:hypothetical protein